MTITDVCPQKNCTTRVSVFADGKYAFSLDETDAFLLGIKKGKELDDEELEKCLFLSQTAKAKEKALNILERKSVTRKMLTDSLKRSGYDLDAVNIVCDELETLGYIDDYAYAALFLEYAAQKLWGERKIRYELSLKGVSRSIIEEVMQDAEKTDAETLAEAVANKYPGADFSDPRAVQRAQRYLASHGFDFGVINEAISICRQQRNDMYNE